jgi:hypothetical protein
MAAAAVRTLWDYPNYQYWDEVIITKPHTLEGCTGYFLSVRVISFYDDNRERKSEPHALIELHHSPKEGCNIKLFQFTEFEKVE